VLWTVKTSRCIDTLEPRLDAMADNLQRLGIGQGSRAYPPATVATEAKARKAPEGETLMCVADMLAPMGHYARFMLKPDHTKTPVQNANTPLDRLADVALPDNSVANGFELAARALLHASTSPAARAVASARLLTQLMQWEDCSAKLAHGERGQLGVLLNTVIKRIIVVTHALASGKLGSADHDVLFTEDGWREFDTNEVRPALLPAAKALLASPSGTCNGECAVYKGMDIGRGSPREYQTASPSVAACCFECTERRPRYLGFVYNFESSACYCKEPGPSNSAPISASAPLLAGATRCCAELWAAGEHVQVKLTYG
jgi:hypothetical protein